MDEQVITTSPCLGCTMLLPTDLDVCPRCKKRHPTSESRTRQRDWWKNLINPDPSILPVRPVKDRGVLYDPPSPMLVIGMITLIAGFCIAGYFLFVYDTTVQSGLDAYQVYTGGNQWENRIHSSNSRKQCGATTKQNARDHRWAVYHSSRCRDVGI